MGTGAQGLRGENSTVPGPIGPIGLQGTQGPQGLKGDAGVSNIPGPQGQQGLQGSQGTQGLKGDTGIQGPIGVSGKDADKTTTLWCADGELCSAPLGKKGIKWGTSQIMENNGMDLTSGSATFKITSTPQVNGLGVTTPGSFLLAPPHAVIRGVEGNLNIDGPGQFYILNKGGVTIGKDWGGNGSLNVQGDAKFASALNVQGNANFASTTSFNTINSNSNTPTGWLYINGSTSNGTAMYNGVSIKDGGGLNVGEWGKVPEGQIRSKRVYANHICINGGWCLCKNPNNSNMGWCAENTGAYNRDI